MVRPHVCMIVHAYYPLGETRVQREAAALVGDGIDVTVFCLRGERESPREVIEGVTVRRLPVRRRRGSGIARQALEYLRFLLLSAVRVSGAHLRRRFDVIQVHTPPDALVFAGLLPKLLGARLVLDIHDLLPEFYAERTGKDSDSWIVSLVRLEERISCALADRVVTVTSHWRDDLERRGVPADKLGVVMNLADPALFNSEKRPEDGRFVVLYHGTFTERYGVDLLVEAAAVLRDTIPGLEVHLVGDGEQRQALVRLVERLGVTDIVSVSDGMVGPELLGEIVSSADVGVVPNRSNPFTDGLLPTKLLEYVLTGTPAVVADTPGVRRYFDEAMVAFFKPGDSAEMAARIRELWGDAELRTRLATSAAAFNSTHSWQAEAARYVGVIRELASGGRRDSGLESNSAGSSR